MIGSGLKKLATQNGMSVSSGVAYGSLRGYTTTMSEGSGYKLLEISTQFPQLEQKQAFYSAVNAVDHSRTYMVQRLEIGDRKITVVFTDTIGTMKRIEAFIDWFYPLLAQHGATGSNVCAECGGDATMGGWYLVNGIVHRFHDSCATHLEATLQTEQQDKRDQDNGSYIQGFFGALGGALIGSVAWAILYMLNYVASLVGLLMGWLAEKGYNLLHGKQGKGKVVILIAVVILGVIIGSFAGLIFGLYNEFDGMFTLSEVFNLTLDWILTDSETQIAFGKDIGLGLLFAGLGVFFIFKKAAIETADVKFKKLS